MALWWWWGGEIFLFFVELPFWKYEERHWRNLSPGLFPLSIETVSVSFNLFHTGHFWRFATFFFLWCQKYPCPVHIFDNFDLSWIWNHVDWWPLGVTFTGFSPNVEWIRLNRPWIGGITFHARLCKNMRNISTVGIFVQRQLAEVEFGWIGENHGQPRWNFFKPCILAAQTSNHRNYQWLLKIGPHNPKYDSRAKERFLEGGPFPLILASSNHHHLPLDDILYLWAQLHWSVARCCSLRWFSHFSYQN